MAEEPKIVEEDLVEEVDLISRLPKYMASCKPIVEVTKDLDKVKLHIKIPLLPENVPFEGEMLAKIPMLKMEDWDLGGLHKVSRACAIRKFGAATL